MKSMKSGKKKKFTSSKLSRRRNDETDLWLDLHGEFELQKEVVRLRRIFRDMSACCFLETPNYILKKSMLHLLKNGSFPSGSTKFYEQKIRLLYRTFCRCKKLKNRWNNYKKIKETQVQQPPKKQQQKRKRKKSNLPKQQQQQQQQQKQQKQHQRQKRQRKKQRNHENEEEYFYEGQRFEHIMNPEKQIIKQEMLNRFFFNNVIVWNSNFKLNEHFDELYLFFLYFIFVLNLQLCKNNVQGRISVEEYLRAFYALISLFHNEMEMIADMKFYQRSVEDQARQLLHDELNHPVNEKECVRESYLINRLRMCKVVYRKIIIRKKIVVKKKWNKTIRYIVPTVKFKAISPLGQIFGKKTFSNFSIYRLLNQKIKIMSTFQNAVKGIIVLYPSKIRKWFHTIRNNDLYCNLMNNAFYANKKTLRESVTYALQYYVNEDVSRVTNAECLLSRRYLGNRKVSVDKDTMFFRILINSKLSKQFANLRRNNLVHEDFMVENVKRVLLKDIENLFYLSVINMNKIFDSISFEYLWNLFLFYFSFLDLPFSYSYVYFLDEDKEELSECTIKTECIFESDESQYVREERYKAHRKKKPIGMSRNIFHKCHLNAESNLEEIIIRKIQIQDMHRMNGRRLSEVYTVCVICHYTVLRNMLISDTEKKEKLICCILYVLYHFFKDKDFNRNASYVAGLFHIFINNWFHFSNVWKTPDLCISNDLILISQNQCMCCGIQTQKLVMLDFAEFMKRLNGKRDFLQKSEVLKWLKPETEMGLNQEPNPVNENKEVISFINTEVFSSPFGKNKYHLVNDMAKTLLENIKILHMPVINRLYRKIIDKFSICFFVYIAEVVVKLEKKRKTRIGKNKNKKKHKLKCKKKHKKKDKKAKHRKFLTKIMKQLCVCKYYDFFQNIIKYKNIIQKKEVLYNVMVYLKKFFNYESTHHLRLVYQLENYIDVYNYKHSEKPITFGNNDLQISSNCYEQNNFFATRYFFFMKKKLGRNLSMKQSKMMNLLEKKKNSNTTTTTTITHNSYHTKYLAKYLWNLYKNGKIIKNIRTFIVENKICIQKQRNYIYYTLKDVNVFKVFTVDYGYTIKNKYKIHYINLGILFYRYCFFFYTYNPLIFSFLFHNILCICSVCSNAFNHDIRICRLVNMGDDFSRRTEKFCSYGSIHDCFMKQIGMLIKYRNNIFIQHFNYLILFLLMRYHTFVGSHLNEGMQSSIPKHIMKYGQNLMHLKFEGFSAPLNCVLNKYYSFFGDIDIFFGSKGNFLEQTLKDGSYELNPPFDICLINKTIIHILHNLKKEKHELTFMLIIPYFDSSDYFLELLLDSPYLVHYLFLGSYTYSFGKKHIVENTGEELYTSTCDCCVFILQNEKAKKKYHMDKQTILGMISHWDVNASY